VKDRLLFLLFTISSSQTCVNTLINETSVKFEATTLYPIEILLFI